MSGTSIDHFHLENGLEVVVIPDRRAPVVTHMVYYRNGSADDPQGKSGIAHFLEHLMFKGTDANPKGIFSEIVAELGGQENAFTSYDYTAYYQRIAKEHLGRMMALESDRMTGLVLEGPEVLSERDVVIEERKMRTDSDPSSQLQEAMMATLYVHHPYGTPVIGWGSEIEGLAREDALAYYRRFYRPENAILIVAGDVERAEVEALARDTYGRIPPSNEGRPQRERVKEPPIPAHRYVKLKDSKVEQPVSQLSWLAPCHSKAEGNDAFALEVLNQILGGSQTSRLYRALVTGKRIALSVGSWYWNDALDMGQFGAYAVPAEGVSLDALDDAMMAIIDELSTSPIDEREFLRAKSRLVADMIYAQDNQTHLARMYGSALTTGGAIEDVRLWSERIEAVSVADVQRVAAKFLVGKPGVTGHLLKAA
jgi:zinc protease